MLIDDNVRAGMTPSEARRAALLRFGGVETTREAYRDRLTLPRVEHVVRDVRIAVRQLRRAPAFSLTAILVLTLGHRHQRRQFRVRRRGADRTAAIS